MIECGLPYNPQQMIEIKTNGAMVDMSNINFPGISGDNVVKTAFIYLRNTGFDKVKLDFSKVDKETKYKYLDLYIQGNIEVKDLLLASTVSKVMNYLTGLNTKAQSILTDDEVKEYIQTRMEMLGKVLRLLISMPIYLVKRFKVNDTETLDMSEYEIIEDKPVGINLKHIIKIEGLALLFDKEYVFTPANYSQIFTIENNELFDTLRNTVVGLAMMVITTEDPDTVMKLMNTSNVFSKTEG